MIGIKELRLSIPDMGKEEGRRLAAEVSHQLAARIPDGMENYHLPNISIRLDFVDGLNRHQLANRISTAIWKDIQRNIRFSRLSNNYYL